MLFTYYYSRYHIQKIMRHDLHMYKKINKSRKNVYLFSYLGLVKILYYRKEENKNKYLLCKQEHKSDNNLL